MNVGNMIFEFPVLYSHHANEVYNAYPTRIFITDGIFIFVTFSANRPVVAKSKKLRLM
jgi:hypothetical protein